MKKRLICYNQGCKKPEIEQIKTDITEQNKEVVNTSFSIAPNTTLIAPTPISLKGDNQRLIALAHNPFFHACMKHIDIQYHDICDEVALGKINLQYMPTSEIIADRLTKAFTQAKFYILTIQNYY